MERYQPDQYGRMMPDAHGQWVSLRAAEITALDAAQKSSADAQATVEALQRERDEEQQRLRVVCQQRNDAQAALDAERETNRGLITLLQQHVGETGVSEGAVDVLKRKLGELTQLQALVRPFAELAKHLDGREFNTLLAILRNGTWIKVTMDDFMALKAATLDATTPAPRQRQVHSCEIPGCVSCANPEEGGDGE